MDLINLGKQKGYLLYDDINELLPSDVNNSEEIEDILSTFGTAGIEVIEETPKFPSEDKLEGKLDELSEESDLDLAAAALEKTNDPVRMYLREMGTVPLLTREGEVEIAKRIERGQNNVLKAISRSPVVIQELLALAKDLRDGNKSIKEVVVFNEDELTEEVIDEKLQVVCRTIDQMGKLYRKAGQIAERLDQIARTKKPNEFRKVRFQLARTRIQISRAIRSIEFTHTERKRLIEKIRHAVDTLRPLEEEQKRLLTKIEGAKGDSAKEKELRKNLQHVRAQIANLEGNFGVTSARSGTRSRLFPMASAMRTRPNAT
jgi:RNA polymerase primary sigma factor